MAEQLAQAGSNLKSVNSAPAKPMTLQEQLQAQQSNLKPVPQTINPNPVNQTPKPQPAPQTKPLPTATQPASVSQMQPKPNVPAKVS